MFRNRKDFLNSDYLSRGFDIDAEKENRPIATRYVEYIDVTLSEKNVTREIFEDEIERVEKIGEPVTIWSFHAAANVIKRPIRSIFPFFTHSHKTLRSDHHRWIFPRDNQDPALEPVYLVWTKSSERSTTFNHLVPLMPTKLAEKSGQTSKILLQRKGMSPGMPTKSSVVRNSSNELGIKKRIIIDLTEPDKTDRITEEKDEGKKVKAERNIVDLTDCDKTEGGVLSQANSERQKESNGQFNRQACSQDETERKQKSHEPKDDFSDVDLPDIRRPKKAAKRAWIQDKDVSQYSSDAEVIFKDCSFVPTDRTLRSDKSTWVFPDYAEETDSTDNNSCGVMDTGNGKKLDKILGKNWRR